VGADVPEWVAAGFGRATYFRAGLPRDLTAERKRVVKLLATKRPTAMAIWDGQVAAEDAPYLRGSLVDFLAYGPGKARFVKFLEAFKPEQGMPTKGTEAAFKAARIDPATVSRRWPTWARSVR
jgi:hypothetical protein